MPCSVEPGGVGAEVATRRGQDQRIGAEQAQVVRDVARAAAEELAQLRHVEAHLQHVELVGQDVVLEAILEDHDVIDRDRARDQDRHAASSWRRRVCRRERRGQHPSALPGLPGTAVECRACESRTSIERGEPVISFEFFPPKTEAGYQPLFAHHRGAQAARRPASSRSPGAPAARRAARRSSSWSRSSASSALTAMAHLTCVGSHRAQSSPRCSSGCASEGLENVLALRGDPPKGSATSSRCPTASRTRTSWSRSSRERFDFCVGGACYPETHPEAPSAETRPREPGAQGRGRRRLPDHAALLRQRRLLRFVERARAAGIGVPIVPGIMPITSVANVRRMAQLCGARIPGGARSALARAGEDDEATLERRRRRGRRSSAASCSSAARRASTSTR